MKTPTKILFVSLSFLIIYSCSVRKDAFFNRKFHSIKTEYNILFNGKQAYAKGLEEIKSKHQDNFWKRLQIEPITFNDTKIDGPKFETTDDKSEKSATPFEKAEEKARKAIEMHSMNINGFEKNSKVDDAYLLLAKSRYYTQRFIPAMDACNYIISNYPSANLNYETRVWRAKSNIRLGNEAMAIESMNLLMRVVDNKEKISPKIKEQAHTAMAMAYSQTDTIQKVIKHLTKATQTFYNKEQSARNLFVLGQIYSELNKKDSARMVFKRLADTRKAPDKYRIHANIALVKNSVKDSSDVLLIKRFKKLIRNSDNRIYNDELYYQIGELYERNGDTEQAISYYKKSLEAKTGSAYQKTYTFESLGNIFFKDAKYLLAGSYYDSVAKNVPKEFVNEKRIRRVKRKNKGLLKLKKYKDIVKNNDSILHLVAMPLEEQTTFFEKHIEKLKKEEEEHKQKVLNSQSFGSLFGSSTTKSISNKGKWYFYNTQSKQFGAAEFERVWGRRDLEDNWRLSDKTSINITVDKDTIANGHKINLRYEISTYLTKIPTKPKEINALKEERNVALYELGLIYKEQFKKPMLAIDYLERLLKINTDKELELPINYHLYQLYSSNNALEKANIYKEFILKNYPFSRFADIINPSEKKAQVTVKQDVIKNTYEQVYELYKNSKYEEVVAQVNSLSESLGNSKWIPKFTLLRALSLGKYETKEVYLEALEFVAFSYANTEEGKKAKEIINLLKK